MLLLLFVYMSLHPQVFLGCPAKTVVTERKERKDAQVSDTHVVNSQSELSRFREAILILLETVWI